jgi:hypothetical protein
MAGHWLAGKRRLAHWWYDLLWPPIRWALAVVFRWLPFPSSVLGPPKNIIWDVAAYLQDSRAPAFRDGHWQIPVRADEVVSFAGDPPAHPAFSNRMLHRFAALAVLHLSPGRLALSEGVVVSPDDRVFNDFTHNWGNSLWRHPVFRRAKMPPMQRHRGIYATIVTPGAPRNYWHWLMDALPRIAVLEEAGLKQFTLITSSRMLPWQAESLRMLGYPPERWVEFGDDYWELESLLVPSFVHETGFSRPWAVRWLRERLLPAGTGGPGRRRIYLSRSNATRRRLINEEEISAFLAGEGFEVVSAENLTVREQIGIFSQAERIVAPHGAGLTNLLFTPEKIRVLELFSPRYVNPCFFSLSMVLRHQYSCLLGNTAATGPATDWVTMAEDFAVPLKDIQAALRG